MVAVVCTIDDLLRRTDASPPPVDTGLLEPRELDDGLLVELQLLGLRECDLLEVLPPHGDSEPDLDFFFLLLVVMVVMDTVVDDDLDEHSVSDVRRSIVVSYALSGVTTAELPTLPYTFLVAFDWFED